MADDTGFPATPLYANSYDFGELLKAQLHAESLKTEAGRNEAFGKIAYDQALDKTVIDNLINPALPEGTELQDVKSDAGEVQAAVYVPGAVAETVAETPPAAATAKTKATAPAAD